MASGRTKRCNEFSWPRRQRLRTDWMVDEWSGRHPTDAHESLSFRHETTSTSPAILCYFGVSLAPTQRRALSFPHSLEGSFAAFSGWSLSFLHVFSATGVSAIGEGVTLRPQSLVFPAMDWLYCLQQQSDPTLWFWRIVFPSASPVGHPEGKQKYLVRISRSCCQLCVCSSLSFMNKRW